MGGAGLSTPCTAPRAVSHVRCDRGGATVWCAITGIDAQTGSPAPLSPDWSRIPETAPATWYSATNGDCACARKRQPVNGSLRDILQWGLPFLLLPDNGSDLRFT